MEEKVTLVKNAIHSPKDTRHFMRVKQPKTRVTASIGGKEIAVSHNSLKVQEVAHDLYDPVYYFPIDDVRMDPLKRTDKTTHCPLKGDTEYFDIHLEDNQLKDAAWHYNQPYERDEQLRNHIAFDQTKVQLIEHIQG